MGCTVEMPVPPSANHLWRSVRTRRGVKVIKRDRYAAWLNTAVMLLRVGMAPVAGPVRVLVTIRGGKGWPANRDIDNAIKGPIDALRHARRIDGDTCRTVKRAAVEYREPDGRPATCYVTVSADSPGG